jgi:hypothetical protein
MDLRLALEFAYFHELLRPKRWHLDAAGPHNCFLLRRSAYERGLPACYDRDILAAERPWVALEDAYRHGALEPDLDVHLSDMSSEERASVLGAAYVGGLPFEKRHVSMVDTETDKATVFSAAFEHAGLRAADAMISRFRRGGPKAIFLAAALKHGGLAPDYDRHIACIENEDDAASVLAGAYDAGLVPDYDAHVAHIESLSARGTALEGAFKHGLAPDYDKHIAPLLAVPHRYSSVLMAAYDAGLAPNFERHIRGKVINYEVVHVLF